MGFFNYVKAASKFKDNEYVLETIKRLKDFDEFHCLRDSSLLLAGRINQIIGKAPEEYIKWMSVCNGGMLFDTTLLSIDSQDAQLGIEFSSLEEYNDFSGMQEFMLPSGYSVIAIRGYWDPICISKTDARIYLWDCEQGDFTDIWDTFYDFLADEVDTALELIANKDLEPMHMPLKSVMEMIWLKH